MSIIIGDCRAEYADVSPVLSLSTGDFMRSIISVDTQEIKDIVVPDFLKYFYLSNGLAIGVYEIPPRVYRLKWSMHAKSWASHDYSYVSLPFPYTVIGLSFMRRGAYLEHLHPVIFFRNSPLEKLEDELFSPPLFNILQGRKGEHFGSGCFLRSFPWICAYGYPLVPNDRNVFLAGLKSFFVGFFESGFTNNMNGLSAYEVFLYDVYKWEKTRIEDTVVHGWPKSNLTMKQYVDDLITKKQECEINFREAWNTVFFSKGA